MMQWILQPPATPAFADEYPSHLHIDLLPVAQGGGRGRALIEVEFAALRGAGSRGVHLGVARDNERALGFYEHLGLHEVTSDSQTVWMGMHF